MTLFLWSFSLLFVATPSFAEDAKFLRGFTCAPEVQKQLDKWGVSEEWTRQVDPQPNAHSFRTNTSAFGVWVDLHLLTDYSVKAYKISSEGVTEYSWTGEGCSQNETKTVKGRTLPEIEGKKKYFTDNNLAALLKSKNAGMIYIWSPGMVYSMEVYPVFKQVAAKMKLPLTVLMDPYFNEELAVKKAKEFKMPFFNRRVESVELIMRDIGTHYPESLIYANGKLSRGRIVGAMDAVTLEQDIRNLLGKLK